MVRNLLTISGTVAGVLGQDSKAPNNYWDLYTYHALTNQNILDLTNGDEATTAVTLLSNEYTCLDITLPNYVYVGQFRCYGSAGLRVDLSFEHTPSIVSVLNINNFIREDIKGGIEYYYKVGEKLGFFCGPARPLLPSAAIELISADYQTVVSGGFTEVRAGLENKTIKQIVHVDQPIATAAFTQVSVAVPAGIQSQIDTITIAPVSVTGVRYDYSNAVNQDIKGDIRWWYSDGGKYGHFEGERIYLSPEAIISGSWTEQIIWEQSTTSSGTVLSGYSVRQVIPFYMLGGAGDGIKVSLAADSSDVSLKYMSYVPSNSSEVRLEFGSSLALERENLKGFIERWNNDGYTGDTWAAVQSRHTGHFEGYEIDIDDGSEAIMYSANVIGIRATSHGLNFGDYIRIYGTTFYNGMYYVLTYSTPHIVVIWGIYDPEIFTATAKIRKVVSIGMLMDHYNQKPNCRGVGAGVQITSSTGQVFYIADYTDSGKLFGSVKVGPDEVPTCNIASIYDVVIDEGWLCNTPGPSNVPEYTSSMPVSKPMAISDSWMSSLDAYAARTKATQAMLAEAGGIPIENVDMMAASMASGMEAKLPVSKLAWPWYWKYSDYRSVPDMGALVGVYYREGAAWQGSFSCITESVDPEQYGNKTGWTGVGMFFDRSMSQSYAVLRSNLQCPYTTKCYIGPLPAKFIIDMGESKVFGKYRIWVQEYYCRGDQMIMGSHPRSWKVEGSNHGSNSDSWDVLENKYDVHKADYVPSVNPPDAGIPGSCSVGSTYTFRNINSYRYYRFTVTDAWGIKYFPKLMDAANICEIDFMERRSSAGVFPAVVNSVLFMDRVERIIPDEHLSAEAQIFYLLSFDQGLSFEFYSLATGEWIKVVKSESGQWYYWDGTLWRPTDQDKPEENTVRFALWYAFSTKDWRMNAAYLSSLPKEAYDARIPNGSYLKFGIGLVSAGKVEAMLKGITVSGTVFNPNGEGIPTEITFSGGSGCIVPSGAVVVSDWVNVDLEYNRDVLFIMDFDITSSGSVSYYVYDRFPKYFKREYYVSYDLDTVDVDEFTMCTGVVLINKVESRWSDKIFLTSPVPPPLVSGSYIRVSGTYDCYDGYYDVEYLEGNVIGVGSKHWVNQNVTPSGAYVQQWFTVGPSSMLPDIQVGSVVKFSDTGIRTESEIVEDTATNYYQVTSNQSAPNYEPICAFDKNPVTEFHSGLPMQYGPVYLQLYVKSAQNFNKFRFKASGNGFYWEYEFPKETEFAYSNLTSPSMENDTHWTTLTSGIVNLPIGAGRFNRWVETTYTGMVNYYRFKFSSNYGTELNAIRISEIELDGAGGGLKGFTLIEQVPGFAAKYLLDGRADSEYLAISDEMLPAIGLDFRDKPRAVSRMRFESSIGSLQLDFGDLVEKVYIISLAGSSTVYVCNLTVGTVIKEIRCEVVSIPKGGWNSESTSVVAGTISTMSNVTHINKAVVLSAGRVISQIGVYNSYGNMQGCKAKLAYYEYSGRYTVTTILAADGSSTFWHNTNGLQWTPLTKTRVPTTGTYYPGVYNPAGLGNFWTYGSNQTAHYTGGDANGSVTFVEHSSEYYGLGVRYSVRYTLPLSDFYIFQNWEPVSVGEIKTWTGNYTVSGTVALNIYKTYNSPDTEGTLKITILSTLGIGDHEEVLWQTTYPTLYMLHGSNQPLPALNTDTDWTALQSALVTVPQFEGVYGDWINCVTSGMAEPYRHYKVTFLANGGSDVVSSSTVSVDLRLGDGALNTSTSYATPVMTSNNTPSPYRVNFTSQEVGWNHEAFRLFDQSDSPSGWKSGRVFSTQYYECISFDFGSSLTKIINKYRIKTINEFFWSTDSPTAWIFKASNLSSPSLYSDTDWVVLDVRSNVVHTAANTWTTYFTFKNYTSYRHYLLKFTSIIGTPTSKYCSVGEVHLCERIPVSFTLSAGSVLVGLEVSVPIKAIGGYYEQPITLGSGTFYRSDEDMHVRWDYYPVKNNRYITQCGLVYKHNAVSNSSWYLAKSEGGSYFSLYMVCSGSKPVANTPTQYWTTLDIPYKTSASGTYFLGHYGNGLTWETGWKSWVSEEALPSPPTSGETKYFNRTYLDRQPNITVRYGNLFSIGDDEDNDRFISGFQPYSTSETAIWGGQYGPFTTDKTIKLYRQCTVDDTQGTLNITFKYIQGGTAGLVIRSSSMDVEVETTSRIVQTVYYNTMLPYKLLEIPPWHKLDSCDISYLEGMVGGWAEEVGTVASGTEWASFWTAVDTNWQLENNRAISHVGMYSDTPTEITFKLCKFRLSPHFYDISDIEMVTHSGAGFQWFELSQPALIPEYGNYYLGWYQPNYPVVVGIASVSGNLRYEYGNYTGTTIPLQETSTIKPCLAARYTSCFSVGMDTESDVIGKFSPSLGGRAKVVDLELGPYAYPREVYLYRACTMTSGDTSGSFKFNFVLADTRSDDYGPLPYSIRDNGHLLYSKNSKNLADGDVNTSLSSYRIMNLGIPVSITLKFDYVARVVAYRYRPALPINGDEFPTGVEVYTSSDYNFVHSSGDWIKVYYDEYYQWGNAPDYWGRWVYIDDYLGWFNYFLFKFYLVSKIHSDPTCIRLGGLELIVERINENDEVVSSIYNVISTISGSYSSSVKLRSDAGLSRSVQSVLNTFSQDGVDQISPGTYFYKGNNVDSVEPVSVSALSKTSSQNIVPVAFTYKEFTDLNLIAWHPLDETESDFSDLSGNNVLGKRIGTLNPSTGRRGGGATGKDSSSADGNILFTLPHHLTNYTLSFWIKPRQDWVATSIKRFDIMGGLIEYGAIPGSWYVSLAMDHLLLDRPYPSLQANMHYNYAYHVLAFGGRLSFGNYGGVVYTGRNYWKANRWYHVAFSFETSGSSANPYRCWINGVRDSNAIWVGYDAIYPNIGMGTPVYPPSPVIMVDPSDIHYNKHDYKNCMYFGIPVLDVYGYEANYSTVNDGQESTPVGVGEFALQHVMHFNKSLSDQEVFSIFRLKYPLAFTDDILTFSNTEAVEIPGKLYIETTQPECLVKCGLLLGNNTDQQIRYRLVASGINPIILQNGVFFTNSVPDYFNFYNQNLYKNYYIEFVSSSTLYDYIYLKGLRLGNTELITSITGSYYTTLSGLILSDYTLLNVSGERYIPSGVSVTDYWSLDGQTWVSGSVYDLNACDGNVTARYVYDVPYSSYDYATVSGLDTLQTTWSSSELPTDVASGIVLDGNSYSSSYVDYSLNKSAYHLVGFDIGSSNGNASFSDSGDGYIMDGSYVCSGTYFQLKVGSRENETLFIPTLSGLGITGNYVYVDGFGKLELVNTSSSGIYVKSPYINDSTTSSGVFRDVITLVSGAGLLVTTSGSSIIESNLSESEVRLDKDLNSGIVTSIYSSSGTRSVSARFSNELNGAGTNVFLFNVAGVNSNLVFDLGESKDINAFQLYSSVGLPDYCELYGTNELPYWEEIVQKDITGAGGWSEEYSFTAPPYRYWGFKFYENVTINQVRLIQNNILPVRPYSVVYISPTDVLQIGRLRQITVDSYEPISTNIYHAVTTNSGLSYHIYQNGIPKDVIKYEGSRWYYWNDSWIQSESITQAFINSVEIGNNLFTSTQLEQIINWDIMCVSGSIGFMAYLKNHEVYRPTLSGYGLHYETVASGITECLPADYSFEYLSALSYNFVPESTNELLYGRKYIEHIRCYLHNPTGSNKTLNEVGLLDYQDENWQLLTMSGCDSVGCSVYVDNVLVPSLSDMSIYTGGYLLDVGQTKVITISGLYSVCGWNWGQLDVWGTFSDGPPSFSSVVNNDTDYFFITSWTHSEYKSSTRCWSKDPINTLRITAVNPYTYPLRINEICFNSIEPTISGLESFDGINYIDFGKLTSVSGNLWSPTSFNNITDGLSIVPIFPEQNTAMVCDWNTFFVDDLVLDLRCVDSAFIYSDVYVYPRGQAPYYANVINTGSGFISHLTNSSGILSCKIRLSNTSSTDIGWVQRLTLTDTPSGFTTSTGIVELEDIYGFNTSVSLFNGYDYIMSARVLPKFSNYMDLDRNLKFSQDLINWYGLDDGINIPRDYGWALGQFENTTVVDNKVELGAGATEGNWTSPIIETLDPSSLAVYVYTENEEFPAGQVTFSGNTLGTIVKYRHSNQLPKQLFLVTAVNADSESFFLYPWKITLFDSTGTLKYFNSNKTLNKGFVSPDNQPTWASDLTPSKYWYSRGPMVWQFYGVLDSESFGAVTLGNFGQQSQNVQEDSYKLYRTFPNNFTFDEDEYGVLESTLNSYECADFYFPVFSRVLERVNRLQGGITKRCWHVIDVVFRVEPFYELYQEDYFSEQRFHLRSIYTFGGTTTNPEPTNEVDYLYSFSFDGSMQDLDYNLIRCGACRASYLGADYYWTHFARKETTENEIYTRTLLCSGSVVLKEFSNIKYAFNFMETGAGGVTENGFWGLTDTEIIWFTYNGTSVVEEFKITSNFKRLQHATVDFANNLWTIDLDTERVIRVNFAEQKIDYDRIVSGATSVAAEPMGLAAYLYIIRPREFIDQDCIKVVHAGAYDYFEPEVICTVPGITVSDCYNVNLILRSTYPTGYTFLPDDPVWYGSTLPWNEYVSGALSLPYSRYKQFKVYFTRSNSAAESPKLKGLISPIPALVDKIEAGSSKTLYIDTVDRSDNLELVAGNYELDIICWWVPGVD